MLKTLNRPSPRMAKKSHPPQEKEHPRFKGGVPALNRRAVMTISQIRAKMQTIRDELALIDQFLNVAEEGKVESLSLDGAMKPDIAAAEIFSFRQKVERTVRMLNLPST